MENSNLSVKEVNELLRKNLDLIQDKIFESTEDYKKIFNYFIGEKFEGISPERLKVCDKTKDKKIDFYYPEDDVFVAYQCKLGEFENLDKVQTYGDEIINEAEDIYTFLTDIKGLGTGNSCAQEARNIYRHRKASYEQLNDISKNSKKYKLEVCIAIYGTLTPNAIERLSELRAKIKTDDNEFEIKLVDYNDIEKELTLATASKDRPEKINLEYYNDIYNSTNDWGYALVKAIKFKELFEKYGMALFDLNVRYYLERSAVNKQIKKTLNSTKGISHFHLLNNGITISCQSWEKPKPNRNYFVLHHPQIINGCQTVISIYRAASEYNEEHLRRKFDDECKVPVRIVLAKDDALLDDIVTASNNQNKMSARNLRSNSTVQRILQKKFDLLQDIRWFYERKDGEFESLKRNQDRNRNFKAKNYEFKTNRYRKVSNEDLAKSWLSFIGFSKDASENIKAFDFEEDHPISDESTSKYEWLFEKRPYKKHWISISLGPQVKFDIGNFESISPVPEQYLLSYFIYEFTKAYLPSPQSNKNDCINKLRETRKITKETTAEEINKLLMEDDNYVLNQILYNMKEVIVELFAMILVKTYGDLDEITTKKIMKLSCFAELNEVPDFKSYVKELEGKESRERMSCVLFTCFEFIKEAISRWMSSNKQEYFTNQRRIRFLHSAKTVESFKNALNKTNLDTKQFAYNWKVPEIDFYSSLPKL